MNQFVYGPVPSRRLGLSLGISPIPKKTCNYSCIYCQLGRTHPMTNTRSLFYPVEDILSEFDQILAQRVAFDVVTIVGEGEPTLYSGLGSLINGIQTRTEKPVAVITNGALLGDPEVQSELMVADIVLPSLDACDEAMWHTINRPHRSLEFARVNQGLIDFSHAYQGQLWIELMLIAGINDNEASLQQFKDMLSRLNYDRLYINTPVRPPAETWVAAASPETMTRAVTLLGGISIDLLASTGFHSEITDDYEAIKSIIKRHPMNQHEIEGFLRTRGQMQPSDLLEKLRQSPEIEVLEYKGYLTFRLK
ncbi:MAG: radical SAM protein [Eubacteriales bacterium]|nr:radical SAM protein [Eubacteriales bacterium]